MTDETRTVAQQIQAFVEAVEQVVAPWAEQWRPVFARIAEVRVTLPWANPLADVKLRACQGINPEMAAELAEGIRQLAADPDHDVLANSPLCPVELEEL